MGFNNAETQESNVYDKIRSLLELYQLFELFEIFQVHDVSIKDTDRPQKCLKIADEIEKLGEDYTILLANFRREGWVNYINTAHPSGSRGSVGSGRAQAKAVVDDDNE